MPATVTLREILIELVERNGFGRVVPVASNTTTTFTLTTDGSPELRGPFTGRDIPIGSPVVCTVETSGATALGNRSYVSDWNASTGVLTVSPAIANAADITEIVVLKPEIKDSDRLIEAINRTLRYRLGRWQLMPLTFVPDGDMQGTTIADYWTAAANGTAAYASAQVFPAGSAADAAGQVGLNRVVQLTTDANGGSTLTGNGIRVPPTSDPRMWWFQTAIRLVSGTGTLSFSIRDNTNTADITLNLTAGTSGQTASVTSFGDFLLIEGTILVPASCTEIAPRITLSAASMVGQMTPIVMFPSSTRVFPLPNRITTTDHIGNFYVSRAYRSPGGLYDVEFSTPIGGNFLHEILDYGDHMSVRFNHEVDLPIWYEEFVYGSALSAMTDTTPLPLERIVRWATFELYDRLMRDEFHSAKRTGDGALLSNPYLQLRNNALRAAEGANEEPLLKSVVGRR